MRRKPEERNYAGMTALLGLITIVIGFVIMVVSTSMRLAAYAILALGAVLLLSAFIIDFRHVKGVVTGRRGRFGAGITVMSSIFVGIVFLANSISVANFHRFDVTALSQFTITQQTKDVLAKLDMPIQVTGFFTPNDPYGITVYANTLLTEYKNYTNQLNIKTIDPDEHPDQARRYGITEYQTIVFESKLGRRNVLGSDILTEAENAFTSAILEVTGMKEKTVYFLSGHGENDVNTAGTNGYSQLRQALRDNLYQVATLDLLRTPNIPDDCAALVIASPQKPMTKSELDTIQGYLLSGGYAIILLNPGAPSDIKDLVARWGITVEDGTIIDTTSYLSPYKSTPSVARDKDAFGLPIVYFPESLALVPIEKFQQILTVVPLAYTSKDSWLARKFDPAKPPGNAVEGDLPGPLAIGVLITPTPPSDSQQQQQQQPQLPGTRLIVVGDSDFASDANFVNGDNGEFFLNAVNLVTMGERVISIERKVLPFRRLIIGPEAQSFMTYSSIGLLPLIVLAIGAVIWWRRR